MKGCGIPKLAQGPIIANPAAAAIAAAAVIAAAVATAGVIGAVQVEILKNHQEKEEGALRRDGELPLPTMGTTIGAGNEYIINHLSFHPDIILKICMYFVAFNLKCSMLLLILTKV